MNSISAVDGDEHELEPKEPQNSQTASQFIDEQLALEADAREILPYKFDNCTNPLGPLRQTVFACLTCSPPPASAAQVYTPAGVCYACSISCHSEHILVELFSRRNFVCDCGTTRFPDTSKCTLRADIVTGEKGVHSQEPAKGNTYNHNFRNHFCCCGEEYDAEKEKGTMFQCLGLGTVSTHGCGEDWYHPECLMGLPRTVSNVTGGLKPSGEQDEHPLPQGFPSEDDFETMVCYKCVESNPWIKQYAGTTGFLPAVPHDATTAQQDHVLPARSSTEDANNRNSLKRKAEDDLDNGQPEIAIKRTRSEDAIPDSSIDNPTANAENNAIVNGSKHERLPPPPKGKFSLFLKSDFRDHICHCPQCYPNLLPHPQLVEEEDTYEPSISESDEGSNIGPSGGSGGARSQGTGSLLDRGEAALSTMDRVKAIEGVMVYNHLRDKVKAFLKPYAESGKPVSVEDIKAYFEKLRGDEAAIKEAQARPLAGDDQDDDHDDHDDRASNRREQSGY